MGYCWPCFEIMPIIDLQCHFGVSPETRALPQPSLADALSYADQYGVETLCFSLRTRPSPIFSGGNARLDAELKKQAAFSRLAQFIGTSTRTCLSSYRAQYFRTERWIGARFEQAATWRHAFDGGRARCFKRFAPSRQADSGHGFLARNLDRGVGGGARISHFALF